MKLKVQVFLTKYRYDKSIKKALQKEIFMWSFQDDENNSQNDGGNSTNNYGYNNQNDGGNGGYNYGYNNYGARNDNGGNNKKPKKHLGVIILLCVALVSVTVFAGYKMGMSGFNYSAATTPSDQNTTTSPAEQNGATTPPVETTTSPAATAPTVTGVGNTAPTGYIEAVAPKCLNSTVIIRTDSGSGSGVIYSSDGYIITNYHVVGADAKKIDVTLYSGETLAASYIYGDESLDITVIKIEKTGLAYAEICSDPVNYGTEVIVVGNALGEGFTLTVGYVSAPEREVTISYETMRLIQIDAAVNSGNSGGGLFNTAGQLVGIVNAKSSGTTSSGASIDNTGYAIPMSTVTRCISDLKEYGYVTGVARLGVTIQNYIDVGGYRITGYVVVTGVSENGSAATSGLRAGDILYKFDGVDIESFTVLKQMLTKYSVGETATLTVLRPRENASSIVNPYGYLRECDEIEVKITFVEFNPNA